MKVYYREKYLSASDVYLLNITGVVYNNLYENKELLFLRWRFLNGLRMSFSWEMKYKKRGVNPKIEYELATFNSLFQIEMFSETNSETNHNSLIKDTLENVW